VLFEPTNQPTISVFMGDIAILDEFLGPTPISSVAQSVCLIDFKLNASKIHVLWLLLQSS
jgi:hypothetical protein